jgi:hypothetical protein
VSRSLPGPAELRPLLEALCNESITDEQVRRLEELVVNDPEAAAGYVQYMSFFADLSKFFAGQTHNPEQTLRALACAGWPAANEHAAEPARPRRSRRWVRIGLVGLTGLAACLLVAVGLASRRTVDGNPTNRPEPTDDTVAVLLQMHRAEWEPGSLSVQVGSPLPAGRLALKSGLARVQFYSGTSVVLEGPAEFQLLSRTEAYCTAGRVRATVPPQAAGFTISTPAMEVIDRGTEFGLFVGERATEVHVFQGRVELHTPTGDQELTTNQGVTRSGNGPLTPIVPDSAAFVTAGELSTRSAADRTRWQKEWDAASREFRRDPNLIVYYPFRADPEATGALWNEAASAGTSDGTIVGCSWGNGRWPGKPGLEFKRVSDRVRFTAPGQFDSITLAAWVRPDALPNENNALMMCDGWEAGELHWQIGSDGTLVLGVRGPRTGGDPAQLHSAHYHATGVITPDRFGRWIHLAVVYDRAAQRVAHYLDGRLLAEKSPEFDIPLRIGQAELGNWNIASYKNSTPVRYFTGCMDEFMLFSRPLSDAEIERLATQGRPQS